MKQPSYRIYPSLLDKFDKYLRADEEVENFWNIDNERRCVVMHDAPLFLFITIQICSLSLSCDLLKISLIYVFPASKNSSCKLIKQSNQPVHTLFCQFCTHLFYIEGNG